MAGSTLGYKRGERIFNFPAECLYTSHGTYKWCLYHSESALVLILDKQAGWSLGGKFSPVFDHYQNSVVGTLETNLVKTKLGLAHEIVSCGESCMKIKQSNRAFPASSNSFQNLTSSSTPWTGRPPEIRTTDPILPIKLERHPTIEGENKFCNEDVNGNESSIHSDCHNPPSSPGFKC